MMLKGIFHEIDAIRESYLGLRRIIPARVAIMEACSWGGSATLANTVFSLSTVFAATASGDEHAGAIGMTVEIATSGVSSGGEW